MKTMIRTCLGLGILAMLATPAMAQGRGGFGRGGLGNLLGNESVQKELKLDDQQIEKAKEVAEKDREKGQEIREALQGLEGEERQTKQRELTKERNEALLKACSFLKPEQIARLKQISYQQRGAQAFSDDEVAKKLNLSDDQKKDIQTIVQESMQERRTIFQENQDDREAAMKKMAELDKQVLSKATSKLNDEQQKTWKELLGAPFTVVYPPRNN